jgi:hypothetical protein
MAMVYPTLVTFYGRPRTPYVPMPRPAFTGFGQMLSMRLEQMRRGCS